MKDRHRNEFVLVPFKATDEMVVAGRSADCCSVRDVINAAIAAAPKFEAVELTEEMCRAVYAAYNRSWSATLNSAEIHPGRAMIAAVRAELGPALGLVELREPTPEDCRKMHSGYYEGTAKLRQPEIGCGFSSAQLGGAMFTAVAKWLKEAK